MDPNLTVTNMRPENIMFHPKYLPSTLVPIYDPQDMVPKIPNPLVNDHPPMPPSRPLPGPIGPEKPHFPWIDGHNAHGIDKIY